MKRIKLFVFLLLLCSACFSDSLIDFLGVPFNADIKMSVKILRDKGFFVEDIDVFQNENNGNFRTTILFKSTDTVDYHTLNVIRVWLYFDFNELSFIQSTVYVPDYMKFEKSLLEKYPYLECSSRKLTGRASPIYKDKLSKVEISTSAACDHKYSCNGSEIIMSISKRH